MKAHEQTLSEFTGRKLIISRVFDAPRDIVFKLWTDPMHLAQWWGPKGFSNPVCESDAHANGKIYIDMQGPDGKIYPMAGTFVEVTPPERIVFTGSALNEYGQPLFHVRNVVTFTGQHGKTKLTLEAHVSNVDPAGEGHISGMETGWNESFDRLRVALTHQETIDRELVITRLLNAPRELVYDVWTNPDHVKNWWGPDGFTNTIFKMDVQVKGEWNFVMHGPDGQDYKNHCVFTAIDKPKLLEYDHVSAPKFRSTVTFEAVGNKTLLTMRMVFANAEVLEKTVKQFGAAEGLTQHIEKVKGYLQTIVNN